MRKSSAIKLDALKLNVGGHGVNQDEVCLMEAVAWFAGEPHSDEPACTSLALAAFGRRLNDWLVGDERQKLVPLIPRLVGTRDDGKDQLRAFMCADWAVRTIAPCALAARGYHDAAQGLRDLPKIINRETSASSAAASSAAAYASASAYASAAASSAYASAASASYAAASAAASSASAAASSAYASAAASSAYASAASASYAAAIEFFESIIDPSEDWLTTP